MKPKGKILLIGDAEDKGDGDDKEIAHKNRQFRHFDLLEELKPKKRGHKIEVITTATNEAEPIKYLYRKAFAKIGINSVGFIDIEDKIDAHNEKYLEHIEKATAVFLAAEISFVFPRSLAERVS